MAEVVVKTSLPPTQLIIKNASNTWKYQDQQRCVLLQCSSEANNAVQNIRHLAFDEHLVPKPWALEFGGVCKGSSFYEGQSSTGRLEFRFPKSSTVSGCTQVRLEFEALLKCLPDIVVQAGLNVAVLSRYRVSDVHVHLAFQRCQRQPFISTGHSLSAPFEEILLMFPLRHGYPIALLNDEKPTVHLDGRPNFVMPELFPGQVLLFTETAYSLLSTTMVEANLWANAFALVRLSFRAGFIGSQPTLFVPFNEDPERALHSGSQQPPICACAICMGPIRERRHGELGGVRSEQDMNCSLFHCAICRSFSSPNTRPFVLCEFCIAAKICPFQIPLFSDISTSVMSSLGQAWSNYFVSSPVLCVHKGFVRNSLVDTLFLLFNPHEFVAGARIFLDFYLNATWHESFAPKVLVDLLENGETREMWGAFYQYFIQNAHCPRVRMVVYAVQCALNTGPVMRRDGSAVPTKGREIFLQGDLRSNYNQSGVRKCIFPRVLLAADLAHGLFTIQNLNVMAIRVFKYLQAASFNTSMACCCASLEGGKCPIYPILKCRGPVLDLSNELGQSHLFNMHDSSHSQWSKVAWQKVARWQAQLRAELLSRKFVFDETKHYHLPGATKAPIDDTRFLA